MGKTLKAAADKSLIVSALPAACMDETAAVEFMESQRWGDHPACPRCGDMNVYKMVDRATAERNKRFLWRCRGCGDQYTVRVGTVMEDSRIPLKYWCFAFWRACSSKKGVSALQIKRETGLSYKSALFLLHRVRYAMATQGTPDKLTGVVEVDETFVGGKPRTRARGKGSKANATPKTPVVALIDRYGEARAVVVANVTGETLKKAIRDHVSRVATLMTDEAHGYRKVGKQQRGGHFRVHHSSGEYVRGIAHINTAESFFSLIKRGVYGTYHAVSKKHLHRYVSEFEFRWNARNVDDGERVRRAIRGADGKRLMYRAPIGKRGD